MAKDKAKAKAKGKASKEKESKKSKKAAKEEAPKKKKGAFGRPVGTPGKGGAKKAKSKRKPLAVFKAPEDFKPFFAKVGVRVDKDGIISDVQMIRVKGNPSNESAKTVDMGLLDPFTLRRFTARYAGAAFIKSDKKRLPGNSTAQMVLRVSANRETGALKCSCKDIRFKEGKDGKAKLLDKKDARYRALRKPMRLIPGAFTKVTPFPSAADLKALLKAQEADE